MAIFEREETYIHKITLRENTELSTPSNIKITITNPCDVAVVDSQDMDLVSEGVYSYGYSLPTLANYGMYDVKVIATDATIKSVFKDKFFVLPWNITDEIRTYSQQKEKNISDDDISLIAWNSFKEVTQRISKFHFHEKLCQCVDETCQCNSNIACANCNADSSPICSDGYQLKNTPIMDFQLDGNIRGCVCDVTVDECQSDICGIWVDSDGICSNVSVDVSNAVCGQIKVYKDDCVTAIPSSNKGIFITYRSTYESYSEVLFKKAVVYLASYEISTILNLTSKKVSGCDESGRVSFTNKLWSRYLSLVESISEPNIGGGR